MATLNDLLGIKPKNPEIVKQEEKPVVEQKKPAGFSLNLGKKNPPKETKPLIEKPAPVSQETALDPFADLAASLDGISFSQQEEPTKETPPQKETTSDKQFQRPTLEDVSRFVFEEQPDMADEEIMVQFSSMLDELEKATGDQIPTNIARALKFIQEHDFLAPLLKPEDVSILVSSMRKSYGFVVSTKTVKSAKTVERNKKVSGVLDALGDFSF